MARSMEEIFMNDARLLANIKAKLPELEQLLEEVSASDVYEEGIYRFYYHSFKVYHLQGMTMEMVKALKSIAPEGKDFCEEFQKIIQEGAGGKEWEPEHNQNWDRHTRVFVEAFLHARFFLEMAVKYGKELERPPETLPYGWAALLCLYQVR